MKPIGILKEDHTATSIVRHVAEDDLRFVSVHGFVDSKNNGGGCGLVLEDMGSDLHAFAESTNNAADAAKATFPMASCATRVGWSARDAAASNVFFVAIKYAADGGSVPEHAGYMGGVGDGDDVNTTDISLNTEFYLAGGGL